MPSNGFELETDFVHTLELVDRRKGREIDISRSGIPKLSETYRRLLFVTTKKRIKASEALV